MKKNTTAHPTITASLLRPLPRAIALSIALGGASVQAAVFNVSTDADAGAGSLRDSVAQANATPGADEITFNPGLPPVLLNSGQIDITDDLTVTGPNGGVSISALGLSRIFALTNASASLTLSGLELTKGRTDDAGDSPLVPQTCAADTGEGGAVCALGNLTITDSTITGNQTSGNSAFGGGVYGYAAVSIGNSLITNNKTTGPFSSGGGVFAYGNLTISNSTVSDNATEGDYALGGGVRRNTDLNGPLGTATITNTRIVNNKTMGESSHGGGIALYAASTIVNSTIAGNQTMGPNAQGGGVRFFASGAYSSEMTYSTVAGNTTQGAEAHGGGVAVRGRITITNSTISGNQTSGSGSAGGGIYNFTGGPTISNTTITENASVAGASGVDFKLQSNGFYNVHLDSTIVAGNAAAPDGNFHADANGTGATLQVDVFASLFADAPAEITGTNFSNVFSDTPGLRPLADNACTTPGGVLFEQSCVQTHGLAAGSQAFDAGDNALNLTGDQRGASFDRDIGPALRADIGAFEGVVSDGQYPALPNLSCAGFERILLRNYSTEQSFGMNANGAFTNVGRISREWRTLGAADFSGDGKPDLVLQHNGSGQVVYYTASGQSCAPTSLLTVSEGWHIAGMGDFNGDGFSDVVARNDSVGTMLLAQWDGAAVSLAVIGGLGLEWRIEGVGDTNGDGRADLVARNKVSGQLFLFEMNGAMATPKNIGGLSLAWKVVGVADLGADGMADIVLRNEAQGQLFLFQMNSNMVTPLNIGGLSTVWKVAGIADLNADNKADLVLRNLANGVVFQFQMNNNVETPLKIGGLNQSFKVSVPLDDALD